MTMTMTTTTTTTTHDSLVPENRHAFLCAVNSSRDVTKIISTERFLIRIKRAVVRRRQLQVTATTTTTTTTTTAAASATTATTTATATATPTTATAVTATTAIITATATALRRKSNWESLDPWLRICQVAPPSDKNPSVDLAKI